jgi:4-amino-4-deoxy-L-arabinose transferase-like glycosyltransferase
MPERHPRLASYLLFAVAFGVVVFGAHLSFLGLPYFWDELGQFVPAALDILNDGAWIPHSTMPNVHPPGVMAYLALIWRVAGYSIEATRAAMLLLATATALTVFLLAIQLCRPLKGAPAFSAVVLLLASPLFYAQAMMAQLDMPAMLFTVLALLMFLQNRTGVCALVCVVLVLMKETGALVPLVLGLWLLRERRTREALWFVAPFVALGAWLIYLRQGTGNALGNSEFAHYNLFYPLHPARLSVALFRRFYYVFIDNFHWIGTIAIVLAWKRTAIFRERSWAICGVILFAHLLMVSVLGGATLERYLLPVIPLFYIAVSAAWSAMDLRWRRVSQVLMTAGLIVGLFWNPPWPFPYENNFAVVDFVSLHKDAAEFVEAKYPNETIVSAWPFPDALRRPEFGYVTRPLKIRGIEDFHYETVAKLKDVDVLVVYSRTWEPRLSVLRIPSIRKLLERYYSYDRQITSDEIHDQLGLNAVVMYTRRGQWIEVYSRGR